MSKTKKETIMEYASYVCETYGQTALSIRCDFDDNTWTFKMPEDFVFTGGEFYIVKKPIKID